MAISLRRTNHREPRRGSALILAALALIPLIAIVAFAVDWGRICVTKAELQRAADSAAMAAAWELLEARSPDSRMSPATAIVEAQRAAMEYSAMNTALGKPIILQREDIEIGYLANPTQPGGELDMTRPELFNAVRVHVRRDAGSNGAIPMFFARIIGKDDADSGATATAAFIDNVGGFQAPVAQDGPHIPMLPLALDLETWHAAVNGEGPDEWRWDSVKNQFVRGSDGVPEFSLYPEDSKARDKKQSRLHKRSRSEQPESSLADDRGTVNIGTGAYSESHIVRQILNGVSLQDWEFHDGSLTFDENGELRLSGKRGLDKDFKEELLSIRGQGRIVPIFSHFEADDEHSGGNDRAEGIYTIVEWAGVRIAEVVMNGRNARIIAQAGEVTTAGTVSASTTSRKSRYISSPVWLAQ